MLSSLNLTLSTNSTKTGENVTLTAIAQPNTFVAVVGIDQSMILLRKPNYIDLDQFKEQSEYISSRPSRRFYGYYSPGFDEVFYRSKLFLRTNTANRGNSYIYPVSLRATTEIYADSGAPAMAMAMAAPSRAPYGKRSSFQTTLPKLALRKDFPETWLWDAKVTDKYVKLMFNFQFQSIKFYKTFILFCLVKLVWPNSTAKFLIRSPPGSLMLLE